MNTFSFRTTLRLMAVAALAVFSFGGSLCLPSAHAQGKPAAPKPGAAAVPGKPGGGGGGRRPRMSPEQMAQHEVDRMAKVMGKPLTAAQKSAVMAGFLTRRNEQRLAGDKYNAAVAKVLGIPVDDLNKKYRAVADAERRGGGGAPPPGSAPTGAKK